MKKFLNYLMYAGLFLVALNFTSCQEEFEEVSMGGQEEPITASSSTAQLITQTVSNDGSFDNIVDGASCFDIRFPYTVEVNGLEITINSKEDLRLIEEIFDAIDDDEDILEILFPITITLADFSEVVINGPEDLRELAEACIEGGGDDDIECIDFVYPITLFTFNVNEERTGEVTVESDKELRRFLAGLEDDDLVSIDFPVTLVLFDGTTEVVDSNAELANAIERAKNLCDEDDDDDFNDDDFTQERLDNLLVECPWLVREVRRDNQDQTDQFFEYLMNFKEDGEVVVKDREGNNLIGEWSTRVTDDGALITLSFDVLTEFNLEWMIYDIGEGRIKLFNGDGNRIILRQFCEMDPNNGPDTLREILRECSWIIQRVKFEGEEIQRLLGFEFSFEGDGVVTLSDGETVSIGTWEIGQNSDGILVLAITMGDEPGVSFEWPLRDLDDNRLKFEVQGFELILLRDCDDATASADEDVIFIRGLFNDGPWEVALFSENDDDTTAAYANYQFEFSNDGSIWVINPNGQEIDAGRWFVFRGIDNKLKMIVAFSPQSNFSPLVNIYNIVEVENGRIELRAENDAGGLDILVWEQ